MTLYDVLEVSPNASTATIRAAYKSLAQRYHPDRNPGSEDAVRRTQQINDAYRVLSDEELRRHYDETLVEATRRQKAPESEPSRARKAERDSAGYGAADHFEKGMTEVASAIPRVGGWVAGAAAIGAAGAVMVGLAGAKIIGAGARDLGPPLWTALRSTAIWSIRVIIGLVVVVYVVDQTLLSRTKPTAHLREDPAISTPLPAAAAPRQVIERSKQGVPTTEQVPRAPSKTTDLRHCLALREPDAIARCAQPGESPRPRTSTSAMDEHDRLLLQACARISPQYYQQCLQDLRNER